MTPPEENNPAPGTRPAPLAVWAQPPGLQIEYPDARHAPRGRGFRATLALPAFWPLRALFWPVLGVAAVGGFAFAVGGAFRSPTLIGITALVGLLLLTSTALLLRNLRRNRAQAVLAYLEQAVRLNLPLPPLLGAAARAETPGLSRRLLRLRDRLEDGAPVAAALDAAVAGLPARAVGLIAAGERTGRLGAALRRLVEQHRCAPRTDPSGAILMRWYPLVLLVGFCNVATVVLIFVIPKFVSILKDFHLPVPAVTRWLADSADLMIWLPYAGGLVLLVSLGRMTGELMAPRLARYSPLRGLTDRLTWYTPLVRGVTRARGLADVCHVLADALAAGHAPHQALEEAAELPANAVLRGRVRRWGLAAEAGAPLSDAARDARMPALVAGMLASAGRGDGTEEVLRFLARYYESRFSRASQLLRGAMVPAMTLTFGALVTVLALACFLPLVALMEKLTPGSTGPM